MCKSSVKNIPGIKINNILVQKRSKLVCFKLLYLKMSISQYLIVEKLSKVVK